MHEENYSWENVLMNWSIVYYTTWHTIWWSAFFKWCILPHPFFWHWVNVRVICSLEVDMSAFPIFHSVNMALIFNLGILELLSYILSQILSFAIKKPKRFNAHSHTATIKANLLNGKWKKLTYLIAIE